MNLNGFTINQDGLEPSTWSLWEICNITDIFSDWSGHIDGLPARYECINSSDVINKRQDVILLAPE